MFKTIQTTWPQDKDLPARAYRIEMLRRVLDGTIYDRLKHPFHEEKSQNGEYIKLRDRRPSVRYRLCRLVVDDAVALLFSEGHFPTVECEDAGAKKIIDVLAKEMSLNEVFIDAATRGAVGSIAILLRILDSRPFLSVLDTQFLTPTWKVTAPDTLESVREQYKASGQMLRDVGYTIADADLKTDFWFAREWNDGEEIWYDPLKVADEKEGNSFARDEQKSKRHDLGFVPIAWVRNLPGGDDIDGMPTIPDEAIDTGIEIDYQLSQAGRALKYSGDPTLLLKEPASEGGEVVKGGGNALVVGSEGDAKLLEINGTAAQAVIEYVRFLRELAIESMHGNRANAEKRTAAPSGRALEIMNQSLIWLADKLRISYGEGALLAILNMVVKAHAKIPLKLKNGEKVPEMAASPALSLRWPAWYPPTLDDMQTRAMTLKTLCDSGLLSRQTAIKVLAAEYDIEDTQGELALADADMKARNEAAMKTATIQE